MSKNQWEIKLSIQKDEKGYKVYDGDCDIGRSFPHNDQYTELQLLSAYIEGLISAEDECYKIMKEALEKCQSTREYARKSGYGKTPNFTETEI